MMSFDHKELLNISGCPWTFQDAYEGMFVSGSTGSGKTSGILKETALSLFDAKIGGVIFTVKSSDIEDFKKYAVKTGRRKDLIFLSDNTFNFLEYEKENTQNKIAYIENIVKTYTEAASITRDKSAFSSSNEEFFRNAVSQLLRNSMTILITAEEDINLYNIKRIVDTCVDIDNRKSYCRQLIDKTENIISHERNLACQYFIEEMKIQDPRTRGNIISSLSVISDTLLRGEAFRLFNAKSSTLKLDDIYNGKVLIVDYPEKEYHETGRIIAGIIKYIFQKYIEAKKITEAETRKPVFEFIDECHHFALEQDHHFLSTRRSSKCICIWATQNIGNMNVGYGKEKTSSIIGHFTSKIICQNGDNETNTFFSNGIGKDFMLKKSDSLNYKAASKTTSTSINKEYLIEPLEFTKLKTGGISNKCIVEYYFWKSGRTVNQSGDIYKKSYSRQECRLGCGAKKKHKCKKIRTNKKEAREQGKSNARDLHDIIHVLMFLIPLVIFLYGVGIIYNRTDQTLYYLHDIYITKSLLFIYIGGTFTFISTQSFMYSMYRIIRRYFFNKHIKRYKTESSQHLKEAVYVYAGASAVIAYYFVENIYKGENILIPILLWIVLGLIISFVSKNKSRTKQQHINDMS